MVWFPEFFQNAFLNILHPEDPMMMPCILAFAGLFVPAFVHLNYEAHASFSFSEGCTSNYAILILCFT